MKFNNQRAYRIKRITKIAAVFELRVTNILLRLFGILLSRRKSFRGFKFCMFEYTPVEFKRKEQVKCEVVIYVYLSALEETFKINRILAWV
jgi:hypothetical protein